MQPSTAPFWPQYGAVAPGVNVPVNQLYFNTNGYAPFVYNAGAWHQFGAGYNPSIFADGSAANPSIAFASVPTTGFYWSGTFIGVSFAGVNNIQLSASGVLVQRAGGGAQNTVNGEGSSGYITTRYTTDTGGSLTSLQKARGTIAAPAVPATNDQLGNYNWNGYNGAAFTTGASIRGTLIETGAVGSAAMGTRVILLACPIGSGTQTEITRWDTANGLSMFGANPVIDANRLIRFRSFTFGTLPAAVQGAKAMITDSPAAPVIYAAAAGGGAVKIPVYSDGVGWFNGG
jgi:hypothetical protein